MQGWDIYFLENESGLNSPPAVQAKTFCFAAVASLTQLNQSKKTKNKQNHLCILLNLILEPIDAVWL